MVNSYVSLFLRFLVFVKHHLTLSANNPTIAVWCGIFMTLHRASECFSKHMFTSLAWSGLQ